MGRVCQRRSGIYGTANDIVIGVDQQGNDWKTAGYWAKLRASTAAEYQTWASADGVLQFAQFVSGHQSRCAGRHQVLGDRQRDVRHRLLRRRQRILASTTTCPTTAPIATTIPNLSPAHYGQEVVEYSQLMKSIDPTIKIGAVLATPPDDYSWSYADLNDNGTQAMPTSRIGTTKCWLRRRATSIS